MDAITLATATSALTVLGSEVVKGVASAGGKDIWNKAKVLLGWKSEPSLSDLPVAIASRLEKDDALAGHLISLLKQAPTDISARSLVDRIDAEKVVVAQRIDVGGDFNM